MGPECSGWEWSCLKSSALWPAAGNTSERGSPRRIGADAVFGYHSFEPWRPRAAKGHRAPPPIPWHPICKRGKNAPRGVNHAVDAEFDHYVVTTSKKRVLEICLMRRARARGQHANERPTRGNACTCLLFVWGRRSPPPPCKSNTKYPKPDGNNTDRCSDREAYS